MQTTATPAKRRRFGDRMGIKECLLVGLILLVLLGWSQNVFDNFLWKVGLNHSTCVTNGFGATFCGNDAKTYEDKLREAWLTP